MAYTVADLPMLQLRLMEAQVAKHKLLTGQAAVTVSYEGKSVTYTAADAYRLESYIADLETQIGALMGNRARPGPLYMTF